MFGWLKKEKPRPDPTPCVCDVQRAHILVRVNDGRQFELSYVGRYVRGIGGIGASNSVKAWHDANGRTGSVHVGDGLYIPLCHVKDIKVTYHEHLVEVKE